MLDHVVLSPRITRPCVLRVDWVIIEYACREANGSLKPVPPGSTRRELYCGQCQAAKCLFTGRSVAEGRAWLGGDQQEERARRNEASKARAWAQGLATTRQPLKKVCWNCTQLRVKLGGYVCRFEPEAEPVKRGGMIQRHADGCRSFAMRLVMEIPPLNGNYRTKGETK